MSHARSHADSDRTSTQPRRGRLPARRRAAIGIVSIMLALLSASLGRTVSSSSHHAYDPGVAPLTGYRLSLGTQYQLSAPGGVRQLTKQGLLGASTTPQCFSAPVGAGGTLGAPAPLSIASTQNDDRDLDVFATFRVARSGTYQISCTAVSRVFVDDADNSGTDLSAALVVLAIIFGVLGVGYALSGLAADFIPRSRLPVSGPPTAALQREHPVQVLD